jgi:hypothetical protein
VHLHAQGVHLAGQAESREDEQYPIIGAIPDIQGAFLSTGYGPWSVLLV